MTDYNESWREYRRRRNLRLFAFVGYMPIVGLFGFLTIRVFHTHYTSLRGGIHLDGVLRGFGH
ncbi:MAG TPA: hypothetical protein VJP02_19640 [Candidatus Sulfotelmatobacter sp.]|nr:hypothetical protein [Candidatus Sulfotelmatobacter sp.]